MHNCLFRRTIHPPAPPLQRHYFAEIVKMCSIIEKHIFYADYLRCDNVPHVCAETAIRRKYISRGRQLNLLC